MFSKAILGTKTNKPRMSWAEYIFTHLIPTSFQSFNDNFRMWKDLMIGNYSAYALLKDDDPFEECHSWFFSSINLDETLPKEFLEYLMQMVEDLESGKEKLIPFTKEMSDEIDYLVGDMVDEELNDD